jgi:hypothetical protein
MTYRTNAHVAWVVENGIVVDEMVGFVSAWAYMSQREVPEDVILRVLKTHSCGPESCRRHCTCAAVATTDDWLNTRQAAVAG